MNELDQQESAVGSIARGQGLSAVAPRPVPTGASRFILAPPNVKGARGASEQKGIQDELKGGRKLVKKLAFKFRSQTKNKQITNNKQIRKSPLPNK